VLEVSSLNLPNRLVVEPKNEPVWTMFFDLRLDKIECLASLLAIQLYRTRRDIRVKRLEGSVAL
jgi:hypothetical protein